MIHTKWFPPKLRTAKPVDKTRYEAMIRGSHDGLKRLKEIILEEVQAVDAPKNLDDYTPGWEYKQADRLGQLRAYRNLLTLLEFIDVERTKPGRE